MKNIGVMLRKYSKCVVCCIDNIQSRQMQLIRIDLRGQAEIVCGKNTLIRKAVRDLLEEMPHLEKFLEHIVGNVSLVFTEMELSELREVFSRHKIQARAKYGVVAPDDVVIPKGPTGMGPEKTSFFQALNLETKIARGSIELVNDEVVIKAGNRVGLSEAKLLNMLNISPFFYGMEFNMILDGEDIYPPAVLKIDSSTLLNFVAQAAQNVAAISFYTKLPTAASVPHSIMNGFKNALAISIVTDYTFEQAKKIKDYLSMDPEARAALEAANNAGGGGGGGGGDAPAAAAAPEPEESEEEDMDMGLFD